MHSVKPNHTIGGMRVCVVILTLLLVACLLEVASAAPGADNSYKKKAVQTSTTTEAVEDVAAVLGETGNIRQEAEYMALDADVEKWGKWLDDSSLFAREEATGYLSGSNNPNAVPYLLKALKDKSFTVRSYSAGGLWKFRDTRIKNELISALKTEIHPNTKYFLISSLLKIHADERMLVPHIRQLIDMGNGGAALARDISDKTLQEGIVYHMRKTAKSSKNLHAQIDSAYILIRFFGDNPHQYLDVFCRVLESDGMDAKDSAIYGLKKVGNRQAINALKKALNTKDETLRHNVRSALKVLGEKVPE